MDTMVQEGVRCGNHAGATIYHATAADVRHCFGVERSVSFTPMTEQHPERYRVASASPEELEALADREFDAMIAEHEKRADEQAAQEKMAREAAPDAPRNPNLYASSKQEKFIRDLIARRDLRTLNAEWVERVRAALSDEAEGKLCQIFRREAGQIIDRMKGLPYAPKEDHAPASEVTGSAAIDRDGMYRDPETGAIYKVQWNKASGNGQSLYAKRMVLYTTDGEAIREFFLGGEKIEATKASFIYASGAVRTIKPEWRMSMEEAKQFGALYGTCMRCGKVLTREESIERAMGPVCSKIENWG